MTEAQTIEHKHKDGRWVKEHIDRDGGITSTSNFDDMTASEDKMEQQIKAIAKCIDQLYDEPKYTHIVNDLSDLQDEIAMEWRKCWEDDE